MLPPLLVSSLLCTKQNPSETVCLWWLISGSTLRLERVAILETSPPTVGGIVFASEGACSVSRLTASAKPAWKVGAEARGGNEMEKPTQQSCVCVFVGGYFICSEFTRGSGGGEERSEGRKGEKERAGRGMMKSLK